MLKDVVELGQGEQADDLVVDILKLPEQLLLRLTAVGHAYQDQRTLGEENHLTAVWEPRHRGSGRLAALLNALPITN